MLRRLIKSVVFSAIIIFSSAAVWAATPEVTAFPTKEVLGQGPLPYNYRIIYDRIHAGGHPLNPATDFKNSDKQVLRILNRLRNQGVKTIIDLENTWRIQERYQKLYTQAGLQRIHIPLHIYKLPNAKEWKRIKIAMKKPVYLHCKWGADRTGAIIGRYLVEEKDYTPEQAYAAVITGGSHAGPLGGLKQSRLYKRLKEFIWEGTGK